MSERKIVQIIIKYSKIYDNEWFKMLRENHDTQNFSFFSPSNYLADYEIVPLLLNLIESCLCDEDYYKLYHLAIDSNIIKYYSKLKKFYSHTFLEYLIVRFMKNITFLPQICLTREKADEMHILCEVAFVKCFVD